MILHLDYTLLYNPINSAFTRILFCIASSICFLVEPAGRSSVVSKAYSLKKYLCVPEGGHGPPYPVLPQLFFPAVPFGSVPFVISFVEGGILNTIQWSHVPTGASGSSEIKTNDFAFAGTSLIVKGGLKSEQSQAYSDGICPLCVNAVLVNFISTISVCWVLFCSMF